MPSPSADDSDETKARILEEQEQRAKKQELRSGLVIGLNQVSRALEQGTLKLVLVRWFTPDDEVLMLKMSAVESLYSVEISLTTQMIKPNIYKFSLHHCTTAPQFLEKLTPLSDSKNGVNLWQDSWQEELENDKWRTSRKIAWKILFCWCFSFPLLVLLIIWFCFIGW